MSCCGGSSTTAANGGILTVTKLTKKIVFLGDSGVGKTCCIERYITRNYQEQKATVSIGFHDLSLKHQDTIIKCQLWDTAGQERYHSVAALQTRDADIGVICFSLDDPASLINVTHWVKLLYKTNNDRIPLVIVGLKSDLLSNESIKEVIVEASTSYPFYPLIVCSSITGDHVDEIFETICKLLLVHFRE